MPREPEEGSRNETQDSQALWAELREELGVDTRSGNSLDATRNSQRAIPKSAEPRTGDDSSMGQQQPVSKQTSDTARDAVITATTSHVERPVDILDSNHETEPVELHAARRSTTQDDTQELLSAVGGPGGASRNRKMDVSQQSPTQINDDRDYDVPFDSLPSDIAGETTRPTQDRPDEQTLQDDDTGAVNFGGDLGELPRPSSQVSEDGGFQATKSDWRQQDQTSQQFSATGYTPFKAHGLAPETPALPKNPFGPRTGIAAPFAGSQLFGQTQFSSAMKPPLGISPASSRPSPNILLNSFSPNVAETSPLKDRTNVSSPSVLRTSSPSRLNDVPATVTRQRPLENIVEETPMNDRPSEDEMTVPESPTTRAPRSSLGHQPLAHYENMKKSQERKMNVEALYTFVGSESDNNEDEDDAIRRLNRRRRAEKKRAQAAQEMEKVRFTPPTQRQNSGEKPSRKRRRISDREEAEEAQKPTPTGPALSSNDTVFIQDSQQKKTPGSRAKQSDESTQGTEEPIPGSEPMHIDREVEASNGGEEAVQEDRIPATSPALPQSQENAKLVPQQPQSEPDLPDMAHETRSQASQTDGGSSSMPAARQRGQMAYGRRARASRRNTIVETSTLDPSSTKELTEEAERSPSPSKGQGILEQDQPEEDGRLSMRVGPRSTRSGTKNRPSPMPSMVLDGNGGAYTFETSSTRSPLSSAPPSSAATTPATGDMAASERADSMSLPSPAGGRSLRKRELGTAMKATAPRPSARPDRAAKRRAPRYGSESTDDSTSPAKGGASTQHPRVNRLPRASAGMASRAKGLFEGMVFAISLQWNESGNDSRNELKDKIGHAGGTIVEEGFDELFERLPGMDTTAAVFEVDQDMRLAKAYSEMGFTALITDGHSRKSKYMQALALGLPCLAQQWITTCLRKGQLVAWQPYLLCAGTSTVLGHAVLSRTLPVYDAIDARLDEVVDSREKILGGQKVLAVVESKKGARSASQPYIFLARAMGANISLVFTADKARETLGAHAKGGRPFDWIYADKGAGTAESMLHPSAGGKNRRKSSRPSAVASNTRVLDTELVIQSLILGKIVEEDEMKV